MIMATICSGELWVLFVFIIIFRNRIGNVQVRPSRSTGSISRQQRRFFLYVERLEQYFLANDIEQAKRAPVLISILGPKTYEPLHKLLTPQLQKDCTYDLIKKLQNHFCPAPITIAERFCFHRRNQNDHVSISEYIVELKRLECTCDFRTFLKEALTGSFRLRYSLWSNTETFAHKIKIKARWLLWNRLNDGVSLARRQQYKSDSTYTFQYQQSGESSK